MFIKSMVKTKDFRVNARNDGEKHELLIAQKQCGKITPSFKVELFTNENGNPEVVVSMKTLKEGFVMIGKRETF